MGAIAIHHFLSGVRNIMYFRQSNLLPTFWWLFESLACPTNHTPRKLAPIFFDFASPLRSVIIYDRNE